MEKFLCDKNETKILVVEVQKKKVFEYLTRPTVGIWFQLLLISHLFIFRRYYNTYNLQLTVHKIIVNCFLLKFV